MTIEQIIGAIGQIATWVTVILVFFTLREMEKQRKASQKPELIIPNVPIFGYTDDNDDIFVASNWSNKDIKKDDGTILGKHPQVSIYNIGAGAAKEIKIKWDFDMQDTIKSIQDYCYHNSIPVVVSVQNNMLKIEFKGGGSYININAASSTEHAYLMPASVTSQGLESHLPLTFLKLLSILVFINMHQSQKKHKEKPLFPETESMLEIPTLYCELNYIDIGGEKYVKKFEIMFHLIMMRYPIKDDTISPTEAVFQGRFEFKES